MSAGLVLRALESGVDGVAVVACDETDCHYGFGSAKCAEEFELARRMSYLLGIEDERLAYSSVHPGDSEKARAEVKGFVKAVKKAGKSKVRAKEG
jgi:coenzyme F420-reducing hydrogenase delta subunit